MNIAIDVLGILGPKSKNRGIGNYSVGQLKALFSLDKDNRYFLLNFYEDIRLRDILNYGDNVQEYYLYSGHNLFLLRNPAYAGIVGNIIRNFINEHGIELYYITSPFDDCFLYNSEWFENTRYIVTVHDIIPYIFKDRYFPFPGSMKWYKQALGFALNADAILVISNSVKNDLVKHAGAKPEKIRVIYEGSDEQRFRVLNLTEKEAGVLRQKYGIADKFIMCTGGDESRKNMAELVEAYSLLPENLREEYQLVIVCKLSGPAVERYNEVKSRFGVQDRVIFTNYVPDEDLSALYNMATVQAFVSQYEGFGLPVLEAMMCGLPVLTSNNSSLGEIAEGAAIMVDPFDTGDISRGLETILTKVDLGELRHRGFKRAKEFNWERTADLTLSAINEIKPGGKVLEKQTVRKVAFFTPLPPIQSGISDYSVDIIRELSNYCTIDVYIDSGYAPSCVLPDNVKILTHKKFNKNNNKYDTILFHVGNGFCHKYMFSYIERYGGAVVLHDYNLHGILSAVTFFTDANAMKYKALLSFDYKESIVKEIFDKVRNGDPAAVFEYPANGFVTRYADRLIVHSNYSKKKLLRKNIESDVRLIHSYAHIPHGNPAESKKYAREKLGIPPGQFLAASFGHIQETKRSIPSLKALHRLACENDNVHTVYVGKLDPNTKDVFLSYIVENKLTEKVTVTGYTSLEDFLLYIDAADVCVNLRYPYNGETSGSLMRLLAKGKCTLVNDLGSFAEIPDDCCVKLPSPQFMREQDEVEKIYEALSDLTGNPAKRSLIGDNARRYAEEHLDIKEVGKKYWQVLNTPSRKVLANGVFSRLREEFAQQSPGDRDTFEFARTIAYGKKCRRVI
jgi:glycosyltransferase involved in cell wall biosynthesis